MASALATGVKQHAFLARARNYGSSLEASVAANFIPDREPATQRRAAPDRMETDARSTTLRLPQRGR